MIDINGVNSINPVSYEAVNKTKAALESGSTFSNVLNDALKDQIMQSAMSDMAGMTGMTGMSGMSGMNGITGMSGMGGIGGTGVIPGIYMPSATAGLENTMLAVAEQGEMSGAHLMLFMLIMMMQTGDGGSELAPIMQMMAQMLSQTTKNDSDDTYLRSNMPMPDNMPMQNNMLDPANTDPSIRRMVDIALSQVGTRERNADGSYGSGNYTEYGAWYGMDGQPWCAMFVSWSANQAGLLNSVVPRHASSTMGANAYRDKGLYSPRASGYLPREGDAIYFQNASSGQIKHVGIVVAYDPQSQRVYTVEGNTSNAVRVRHYSVSDPRINGYGRNGGTSNGVIPGGSTSGSGANTV